MRGQSGGVRGMFYINLFVKRLVLKILKRFIKVAPGIVIFVVLILPLFRALLSLYGRVKTTSRAERPKDGSYRLSAATLSRCASMLACI